MDHAVLLGLCDKSRDGSRVGATSICPKLSPKPPQRRTPFNRTVVGTQTRLSQLETGWRWYFSVTPLVDGDLVEAARGESEPIDL